MPGLRRTASSSERLALVVVAWAFVAVAVAVAVPWTVALLVGWDAAALTFLASVWLTVGRFTSEETRELATREDNSRVAASFFLLTASVASLAGAGFALVNLSGSEQLDRTLLTVVSALTVFLSWGVVQTVFALRYAHEYYGSPEGGVDFGDDGDDGDPDYQDFAYLAFTVGMTFQVSDTTIGHRRIRRTVIRHALLAYLFGAVILAVMVNVIAGLTR